MTMVTFYFITLIKSCVHYILVLKLLSVNVSLMLHLVGRRV